MKYVGGGGGGGVQYIEGDQRTKYSTTYSTEYPQMYLDSSPQTFMIASQYTLIGTPM